MASELRPGTIPPAPPPHLFPDRSPGAERQVLRDFLAGARPMAAGIDPDLKRRTLSNDDARTVLQGARAAGAGGTTPSFTAAASLSEKRLALHRHHTATAGPSRGKSQQRRRSGPHSEEPAMVDGLTDLAFTRLEDASRTYSTERRDYVVAGALERALAEEESRALEFLPQAGTKRLRRRTSLAVQRQVTFGGAKERVSVRETVPGDAIEVQRPPSNRVPSPASRHSPLARLSPGNSPSRPGSGTRPASPQQRPVSAEPAGVGAAQRRGRDPTLWEKAAALRDRVLHQHAVVSDTMQCHPAPGAVTAQVEEQTPAAREGVPRPEPHVSSRLLQPIGGVRDRVVKARPRRKAELRGELSRRTCLHDAKPETPAVSVLLRMADNAGPRPASLGPGALLPACVPSLAPLSEALPVPRPASVTAGAMRKEAALSVMREAIGTAQGRARRVSAPPPIAAMRLPSPERRPPERAAAALQALSLHPSP